MDCERKRKKRKEGTSKKAATANKKAPFIMVAIIPNSSPTFTIELAPCRDTSDDEYEALMKSAAGKKSSESGIGTPSGKRQRKSKARTPIILPPPPKPSKQKVC